MSVKLLTEHQNGVLSLKGGCTGLYESTIVKMPHCWKSYVEAHLSSGSVFFGRQIGRQRFKSILPFSEIEGGTIKACNKAE